MKIKSIIMALLVAMSLSACSDCGKPYKVVDGRIVLKTPKRPKGQEDMLLFAAEPIDVVRVGFIGLGDRGAAAPKRWAYIEMVL